MQSNFQQSVNQLSDHTQILENEVQPGLDQIAGGQDLTHQYNQLDNDKSSKSQKPTIKISVQECKKQLKSEQNKKQCRICLDGEQQGRMIRPCQCSGSISFAHEKCIMQWIKRKHDVKSAKNKPCCEMCNTPFHYKYGKKRRLNMQQFCMNYHKERCNFFLFYLMATFLLLVIVGLIVIVSECDNPTDIGIKIKETLVKSENIKIIYICVIFILIIILMFLLILFVIEYGVKSQISIIQVIGYSSIGINKRCRIFPKVSQERRRNNSMSIF